MGVKTYLVDELQTTNVFGSLIREFDGVQRQSRGRLQGNDGRGDEGDALFFFSKFFFLVVKGKAFPIGCEVKERRKIRVSKNAHKRCQNKPIILIEREENLNKHFLYSNRRSHFRFTTRECMF